MDIARAIRDIDNVATIDRIRLSVVTYPTGSTTAWLSTYWSDTPRYTNPSVERTGWLTQLDGRDPHALLAETCMKLRSAWNV